jgi:hypothetical protein
MRTGNQNMEILNQVIDQLKSVLSGIPGMLLTGEDEFMYWRFYSCKRAKVLLFEKRSKIFSTGRAELANQLAAICNLTLSACPGRRSAGAGPEAHSRLKALPASSAINRQHWDKRQMRACLVHAQTCGPERRLWRRASSQRKLKRIRLIDGINLIGLTSVFLSGFVRRYSGLIGMGLSPLYLNFKRTPLGFSVIIVMKTLTAEIPCTRNIYRR